MNDTKKSFFTNQCTNIAKGIAILILLFHHLALNEYLHIFDKLSLSYKIAQNFKVCVAIFLILSGYGLNASFNKNFKGNGYLKESIKFSLKHLFKLILNFAIIYVIFVSIGHFTGIRTVQDVYGESHLVKYMCLDFFGVSDIFKTPKYNLTWWFMGLIIILYISFPIWKLLIRKVPIVLLVFALFINKIPIFLYNGLNEYLIYFVIGMIFSEYFFFDKIKELYYSKKVEIITATIIMFVCFYLRMQDKMVLYNTFSALSIIGFGNHVIYNCGEMVKKIFEFLGKHSSNMFMLHTFLYSYFCADFFKILQKWYIMYLALVISSLLVSVVIELIKKVINKYIIQNIKKCNKRGVVLKNEKS